MAGDPDIEAQLAAILARVLGTSAASLADNPSLPDHGWESTIALEALVALEQAFQVTLDLRSYTAARDLGALAGLVAVARVTS